MRRKKNIIKEVFIFMLLTILILLVLAIALYDFIPSNVTVPEAIEYSASPETISVKQEIAYTNGGDITPDDSNGQSSPTSLKSYSIQASDLTIYGQKNLYNSGNSNPFDDYATEENTTNTGNTTGQTNSGNEATNQAVSNTVNTGANKTTNTTTGTLFEKPNTK